MSWQRNRYCNNCHYRMAGYAKCFSANDLIQLEKPCPKCGSHKHWKDFTEQWISDAVTYKPWTWLDGHWDRLRE